MNFYRVYGLDIVSEISLPELRPYSPVAHEPRAEAEIVLRPVREGGLEDGQQLGPFLWANENAFWLQIPNVARFEVLNGKTIAIEPAKGSDEASIRVFLLGSIFAALLFQRDKFLLHGNAVQIGESCLVCVGPSGAGKSTLAAGMQLRGLPVLADDVVAIDDKFRAMPGIPRVKLWDDAIDHLEFEREGLDRVRPGTNKFSLPLANHAAAPLPIKWIYELKDDHVHNISLEPVSGMKKLMKLRENTYRQRYLDGMGLKPQHLEACSALASRVRLVTVTRPRDGFALEALIDTMLKDAAENA